MAEHEQRSDRIELEPIARALRTLLQNHEAKHALDTLGQALDRWRKDGGDASGSLLEELRDAVPDPATRYLLGSIAATASGATQSQMIRCWKRCKEGRVAGDPEIEGHDPADPDDDFDPESAPTSDDWEVLVECWIECLLAHVAAPPPPR